MRTDRPWLEIARIAGSRQPKPPRLIEEEVAPGRLLFALHARRKLTVLAVAFGLAGAGAIATTTTRRASTAAAKTLVGDYYNPFFWEEPTGNRELGPLLLAVLPPGRRLDPVL